ncbi:arylesterase [Pigmentiphaga soli]|uniref:Arylesterase n=1 Tax=Pigmentiphaga soli TaxID=1007095 RepID=A0ABP8HG29_9BURK
MIKPRLRRPARRACLAVLAGAALLAAVGPAAAASAQTGAAAAGSGTPRLLVLGDSLSAEYGLARGTGWVALLAQRLQQRRLDYEVVNASISGETTSGGVSRLPALLAQHRPAVVVVELGSNDALRGLPLAMTEQNLRTLVASSQKAGARVLLVGMRIPPNYGRDYTERFRQVFQKVAAEQHVPLVPFLLEGMAEHIELFQADRLHPVAEAQPRLLDNVWSQLEPLLR